jgi:protein involved in polysaccharide export with SLBB domain
MKRKVFLLPFLIAVLCSAAAAQNQTRSRRVTNPDAAQGTGSNTLPSTLASSGKQANHFEKRNESKEPSAFAGSAGSGALAPADKASESDNNAWGNSPIVTRPRVTDQTQTAKPLETSATVGAANTPAPKKLIERTSMAVETPTLRVTSPPPANHVATGPISASRRASPTEEYRVGVGDVLDIRVLDMPTRESTLFTVLTNGFIEYPLLNAPVNVAGLTTEEIGTRLAGQIKVIENARLSVNMRDYASHGVVITGLVDNPGRRMLRREAMPLYAVLAEALPRAEASFATIVRDRRTGQPLSINDQKAMSTLLLPGDVVKISGNEAAPKQFVYVGGQVVSPGEKDFRGGMTLTQAILASGGAARDAGKSVRISRRSADGFLAASEYDMSAIRDGRSPDPLVQAGDRIEVGRALW